EGEAATSARSSTLLDLGGTYEFKEGFDLLFCGGRAIHGQPETYAYVALYWTWGPHGADSGEGGRNAATNNQSSNSRLFSALRLFQAR
ncbi:MAG TPA: hypothetical protein VJU82_13080, partial [Acidobacteriaceae bacterium]|nr:hypothetical protein [Acidobacteriaceae bacterium]